MPRVFRATTFLALTCCALGAAACGDPFQITAPFQTVTERFAVRTLTQTPTSARVAWRIGAFTRYRLDSLGEQFDVGFDIDAAGRLLAVPSRRVTVSPPGTVYSAPSVGLQVSSTVYQSVDRAPETGYTVDSAIVIAKGQAVIVRSNSNFCSVQNTGGTQIFAKFVVDSINTATRELYVRSTIQPSCGYRSFAEGRPTF